METERKAGEDPKTMGQLRLQIEKLDKLRAEKGCETASANLKQTSDFDVYKRADEGDLQLARVIERAKQGKLVDGSGASINELSRIIAFLSTAMILDQRALEDHRGRQEGDQAREGKAGHEQGGAKADRADREGHRRAGQEARAPQEAKAARE